jgi:hypothetical protein
MRASQTDGVLEGHAAVFNTFADIGGWFREQIAPGAFDRAIREGHDVRALINHDPNLILGRTSSKTLQLSVDDIGLKIRLELPNTSYAKDLEESVKRGDISQMSFGFISIEEEWIFGDEGDSVTIKDLRLFDVSPVTYPAYVETDISARNGVNRYRIEKENYLAVKRAARAKRLLQAYKI